MRNPIQMTVGILIPSLHEGITDYQKKLYARRNDFFLPRWVELVHVAVEDFDLVTRSFSRYQKMEGENIVTVNEAVLPGVLWRKMSHSRYFIATEIEPYVTVVPSNRVAEIANNKHATYLAFRRFQPATALVSEYFEYENVRNRLKGETLILKPTEGYGGKGIRKITRTELADPAVKESLVPLGMVHVLQEFKDFSKGVPGVIDWVHDFRLDHVGGKISITSVRYPKNADEFRCNVSAWGGEFCPKIEDVPKELLEIWRTIAESVDPEGKEIFSIDFSYAADENRWYLIEANDSPGLQYPDEAAEKQHWENVVAFFKTRIK